MPERSGSQMTAFEVVISIDDGLEEDHAELLRERLITGGFHDHVVSVREVEEDGEELRADGGTCERDRDHPDPYDACSRCGKSIYYIPSTVGGVEVCDDCHDELTDDDMDV